MTFDSHAHRWKRDAGHVCSRLPPSTTGAGRQAELAAPVSGETFSLDIPFHRTLSPKGARARKSALPCPTYLLCRLVPWNHWTKLYLDLTRPEYPSKSRTPLSGIYPIPLAITTSNMHKHPLARISHHDFGRAGL